MANENSEKQEVDPNFAEFLKAESGEQGSSDNDPVDDINPDNQESEDDLQNDNLDDDPSGDDEQDSESGTPDDSSSPDKTITMLQEQITNLTNLVAGLAGKKDEAPPVAPEPEVSIFESDKFKDLAEGMSWDEDETSRFKDFMTAALEANSKKTLQDAMNDIPGLVNSSVTANQTHAEIRKNFLTEHSALKPVTKYVSEIADSISKEYAQIGKKASLQEILNEAANRSYENLGIKKIGKQSKAESRSGKPNPAFPKNRSNSRKPTPKATKMQNDIAAIMSLDN